MVQVLWFRTGTRYDPKILLLCEKMMNTKGKKCWGKLARNLFALPPPILNRVENEFAECLPVNTIKKVKYQFDYFIACSVEVAFIFIIIILENMFWNIKSAVFTNGGIGEGEFCCWTCMFANTKYQPP